MSIRDYRNEIPPRAYVFMCLAFIAGIITGIVVLGLVSVWVMNQQQRKPVAVVMIAGAEDDCLYRYDGHDLREVVGVEVDGRHRVECRY